MKSMSNYAKRYDQRFRDEAVRLLIESGRPISEIASELGVSVWSLRRWKQLALEAMGEVAIDGEKKPAAELEKELQAARREIAYLKQQRAILKKAMSILGEESTGGMR